MQGPASHLVGRELAKTLRSGIADLKDLTFTSKDTLDLLTFTSDKTLGWKYTSTAQHKDLIFTSEPAHIFGSNFHK